MTSKSGMRIDHRCTCKKVFQILHSQQIAKECIPRIQAPLIDGRDSIWE